MKHYAHFLAGFLLVSALGCQSKTNIDSLLSDNEIVRNKAIARLSKSSPAHQMELVPSLILALNHVDSRTVQRAQRGLAEIGTEAVPALTEVLKTGSVEVRIGVLEILALIGSPAHSAIPAVTEYVNDPHPLIKEQALIALKSISQNK